MAHLPLVHSWRGFRPSFETCWLGVQGGASRSPRALEAASWQGRKIVATYTPLRPSPYSSIISIYINALLFLKGLITFLEEHRPIKSARSFCSREPRPQIFRRGGIASERVPPC